MPRLHFCTTVTFEDNVQDINPLLLQLHKGKRVLVLAGRDGQEKRIRELVSNPNTKCRDCDYHNWNIIGWWGLAQANFINDFGLFDYKKLDTYDAVVILDPSRVDPLFQGVMKSVIDHLKK